MLLFTGYEQFIVNIEKKGQDNVAGKILSSFFHRKKYIFTKMCLFVTNLQYLYRFQLTLPNRFGNKDFQQFKLGHP